jgi:hypothetical protein
LGRWDEQAEEELVGLGSEATPGDIARARELASHYRWRSKALAPADYGDRQAVEVSGKLSLEQILAASRRPAIEAPEQPGPESI